MKFKKGQEVVIKKNLGELNGYSKKGYYYGGNIGEVPLGTKGKIYNIYAIQGKIGIEIKSGVTWLVHPNEIDSAKEWKEAEEKRQNYIDSHLEDLISSNVTNEETIDHSFKPSFNVREEYALWLKQEFPDLGKYALNKSIYKELQERKEEVLAGAKKAFEHAMETTMFCTKGNFEYLYDKLTTSTQKDFAYTVNDFQGFIFQKASNLDLRDIK